MRRWAGEVEEDDIAMMGLASLLAMGESGDNDMDDMIPCASLARVKCSIGGTDL